MTVGVLAKQSNVSLFTVRHFTRTGLLEPSRNLQDNKKIYQPSCRGLASNGAPFERVLLYLVQDSDGDGIFETLVDDSKLLVPKWLYNKKE